MGNVEVFKDFSRQVNMQFCLQTPVRPVKFSETDRFIGSEASWEIIIGNPLLNAVI